MSGLLSTFQRVGRGISKVYKISFKTSSIYVLSSIYCKFHYEEMNIVLVQMESILNRPLTPISSDPLDLVPLSPAYFLIGRTHYVALSPGRRCSNQHALQIYESTDFKNTLLEMLLQGVHFIIADS